MAQSIAWLPNAAAAWVMSAGLSTAAEFTDTLSAPAAIIVRISATLRKPPPTQYGRCSCSLARLARPVSTYPQVLVNAYVSDEKKHDYDKDEEILAAIKKLEQDFHGEGRVLIRTSGTEPMVRVMIEGKDKEAITKQAVAVAKLIEKRLK